MSKAFKIAIAGLGTVGAGTVKLIQSNLELLRRRSGHDIEIVAVSARSKKDRGVDLSSMQWFDDAVEMARTVDADLVMELIGGSEGIARDVVETALGRGLHVITANKALLAHHGASLARLAEEKGVSLAYEAAVAGGIPIIKGLREGLAANGVSNVYGILNGTCNYILTNMKETGRDFEEVLKEAQDLGYAEAEPSTDVDGFDASHKLALLSSLAFGVEVDFDNVYIEGIRNVSSTDIAAATDLGYKIKLLGITKMVDGKLSQRVHPCMVEEDAAIGQVDGVLNAVVCNGGDLGYAFFEGPGAGAGPTASAVVADLVDILRGLRLPVFGIPSSDLNKAENQEIVERFGAYYLRLTVRDQPGVIADVTAILRDHSISVRSMIQRNSNPGKNVSVIITTHDVAERDMRKAIDAINALEANAEPVNMIRIANVQMI
ncbi:homoserine dehydrogenase [Kiloniella sp. b19]|uniref:homoserine dehydrogenase n=1 Tax=Kiloniella sp. GXU_MW_B19 TaxID=3141326 RepID=UPI0031D3EDB2